MSNADFPFAAVEQGDVALLETGGVAYRCNVWQRMAQVIESGNERYRGIEVHAAVYTIGAHGQEVLIDRYVVRTPGSGDYVDSPKIVAMGTTFHVHWIEYDPTDADGLEVPQNRTLHRSTYDVTDSTYAWDYRGSIATGYQQLYDIHTMDSSENYVLAHATDDTTIAVYRVNGDTWVDNEWNISQGGLTVDQNVLAVVADRSSPLVLWQSSGALYGLSRAWADGTAEEAATQLVASPGGDIVAVGGTRVGDGDDGEVFVVYEYQDDTSSSGRTLPTITHFNIDAAALAAPARTVTTPNISLESKPWTYVSQRNAALPSASTPGFFFAVGYINCNTGNDWLQSSHYIVRAAESGAEPAVDGDGRPIPVATLNYGIAHSAMHGKFPVPAAGTGVTSIGPANTKRRNHIPGAAPAPSYGPMQKTYTTVLPKWTRTDSSSLVAGAELRSTTFHHDDPWAFPYDSTDAALPTEPYASVSVPMLEHVPAGEGLFLGGGTPQMYDGHRFVECGFPWRPELLRVVENNDPGGALGSLTAGTYTYAVVAEWRDAKGQTHRAISDPVSGANSNGYRLDLDIRCINLSMKDNTALGSETSPPIKFDVYRTESGGTTFYPLYRGATLNATDLLDVPLNDPTTAVISISDELEDGAGGHVFPLATRTPLPYTFTSGVWNPLLPENPPAMTAVARWQNRVWGVAAEDPASIWYSQEILPEIGGERYSVPEFSPTLRYRIDGIGRVVAMQEMDSALIIFTRDAIYSLTGHAADSTGSGSTLELTTLQKHTGCIEPRSVASATDGLYFQSRRGFYHLSRQNTLSYVGAPVEDALRAAGNVRAVTVHEDSHQVRLLCNDGAYDSPQVLVYDWLMKFWAQWPLPAADTTAGRSSAVDALVWRGHVGEHAHVVSQTTGLFIQKSSTSASRYADESGAATTVAIPVDVRTGWIHLAGLAGFKRVRKIGLHLTKAAAAPFTVQIEYDLDGQQTDLANIQTETFTSTDTAYFEIRTSIQKCISIRIRIFEGTDAPTGAQLTSSTLNLHAITLVVARKPGLGRVSPTSQRT